MNALKTPAPTPSFTPTPAARDFSPPPARPGAFRPNAMSGKIRKLVESHPAETIEVLRRWLGERGGE